MYLHECYVVPKAALIAVVEYLRKRPFDEVAGLLDGLDGSPEGTAKELAKAGAEIHKSDAPEWIRLATKAMQPTPGETVVDFPAGVERKE